MTRKEKYHMITSAMRKLWILQLALAFWHGFAYVQMKEAADLADSVLYLEFYKD